MIFSSGKRTCITGMLLLGLASCGSAPEPSSDTPSTTSQPTTESASAESLSAESPSTESPPESTLEIEPEVPEAIAVAEGDIWSRLRQADTHYYVFMRHAIAPGTGDPPNFQLSDCATQRNLSEAGITQARRTGEVFREQSVAVQQVLSSEWCRCLDTATLMDLGPVEPFPALNSFFADRTQEPERTEALRTFMMTHQDEPGVTILVTHFVNITAIAGDGVASGELVVMQVNDQNEPEVVEQIEPF